jgi:hypothetical protein
MTGIAYGRERQLPSRPQPDQPGHSLAERVDDVAGTGVRVDEGQAQHRCTRVPLGSVDGQAEPERQTAGAAAEVEGQVRRVVDVTVDGVEIVRRLTVRGACRCGVPVEQCAAVVGGEEPFVGIDDEAVGAFDAGVEVPNAGCRQASVDSPRAGLRTTLKGLFHS